MTGGLPLRWVLVWLAIWAVLLVPALLAPTAAHAQGVQGGQSVSGTYGAGSLSTASAPAERLRQRYAAARDDPALVSFDRPLVLQSTESSDRLQGDVFAMVDHPYEAVRAMLVRPAAWCNILILHLNVQYCRAGGAASPARIDTGVGRKHEQALDDLYWVRFTHSVERDDDAFAAVKLQAPSGPFTTRDYQIEVEAAPAGRGRSLVHLRYAYGFGLPARLAMQTYLATLGAGKVGFSTVSTGRPGAPAERVGGLRGVLERNTLRYHLAIDAALAVRDLPPAQQMPRAFALWFDATERYPEQLHELARDEYLAIKQRAVVRQQSTPPPAMR